MSWLNKIHPHGTIPSFKVIGTAHQVFSFIHMMADTFPIETDKDWWQVRMAMLNWRN